MKPDLEPKEVPPLQYKLRIIQGELAHHIEMHEKEMEGLHSKLDQILDQARKTNGRVTHLESEVHRLDLQNANHVNNCPNSTKIEEINKNLLEYNFLQKHPGAIYFAIAVMVVLIMGSLLLFYVQVNSKLTPPQETQKKEQTNNTKENGTRIADTGAKKVF